MTSKGWGSSDIYFARSPDALTDAVSSQKMSTRLRPLLKECLPDAEMRVNLAVKNWGPSIREQLRVETALRLSSADQHASVPVRVSDGVPPPLWKLLDVPEQVLRLVLMRGQIALSVAGVRLVRERRIDVVDLLAPELAAEDHVPSEDELRGVEQLLSFLVEELQQVRILEEVWREPVDWLGAYFFQKPVVEIYWMPIAITAATFRIDLEALTYVVLAHELAHAYTHLGRDIDGHTWDTQDFANTSGHVIEGLAQYYARALCRKVAPRYPAALTAFDALLERQRPGPYADFEGWATGAHDPGEHMRRTMLVVRKKGIREYPGFRALLGEVTG